MDPPAGTQRHQPDIDKMAPQFPEAAVFCLLGYYNFPGISTKISAFTDFRPESPAATRRFVHFKDGLFPESRGMDLGVAIVSLPTPRPVARVWRHSGRPRVLWWCCGGAFMAARGRQGWKIPFRESSRAVAFARRLSQMKG
jgi:hypothetical protein